MTKTIEYNELRKIKDSLPDGSIHKMAKELNLTVETIWNYFGGHSYKDGESCGVHIEAGPNGGIVLLEDTAILDMALEMIDKDKK